MPEADDTISPESYHRLYRNGEKTEERTDLIRISSLFIVLLFHLLNHTGILLFLIIIDSDRQQILLEFLEYLPDMLVVTDEGVFPAFFSGSGCNGGGHRGETARTVRVKVQSSFVKH